MSRKLLTLAILATAALSTSAIAATKPTIVLVHGAFAGSSNWNGVVAALRRDGYTVIAAANPLRSVKSDAASVGDLVASIKDDVVLVGHSYGGAVITEAAEGHANVKALVYVSAFSPDTGETSLGLTGKFPGSSLGPAIAPVTLSTGAHDLYIHQDKFPAQFAADVPLPQAQLMASTQRPVTDAALNEPETAPAWSHVASFHIYGDADKTIPPQALAFMADRAKSKKTMVVKGGSHATLVSHPKEVASFIEAAASAADQ
jgi:pimeloyl-ACP methyl ester carboxylesterase